jgi:hypothetical protein
MGNLSALNAADRVAAGERKLNPHGLVASRLVGRISNPLYGKKKPTPAMLKSPGLRHACSLAVKGGGDAAAGTRVSGVFKSRLSA